MKKPYFNKQEREYIHYKTPIGEFMLFRIAWLKFIREVERSKLVKYLFKLMDRYLQIK